MWTETTQPQYRRDGLRYASDVTDQEWAAIETLLPLLKQLGRPRTAPMRQVVNAMLYLLTTGCQWRLLPKEFPPFSTSCSGVGRFGCPGGNKGVDQFGQRHLRGVAVLGRGRPILSHVCT